MRLCLKSITLTALSLFVATKVFSNFAFFSNFDYIVLYSTLVCLILHCVTVPVCAYYQLTHGCVTVGAKCLVIHE